MNVPKIFAAYGFSLIFFSTGSFANLNYSPSYKTDMPTRLARLLAPVQVPVTVSVANTEWIETISICNTSPNAIPLKNIELRFNYASPMPVNIWGEPWANWKVASQIGTQVTLTGGTSFTPDLAPDPSCMRTMSIRFYAPANLQEPTGPFEFKIDDGAPPVDPTGKGAVSVAVGASPLANLPVPIIAINGTVNNQQRQVSWGTTWKLANLTPGSYFVTGVPIVMDGKTYSTTPKTVTVTADMTTEVAINYQPGMLKNSAEAHVIGTRTLHLINHCAKPLWVDLISGPTPNRNGKNCRSDADCFAGSSCVVNGQCHWKNPNILNHPRKLAANNGQNDIKIPIYDDEMSTVWTGTIAAQQDANVNHGVLVLPATLAEFMLNKRSSDYYDVSIAAGMNVPIAITSDRQALCGGNPGQFCSWQMAPPSNDYVWVKAGGKTCAIDTACAKSERCGLSFDATKSPALNKTCGEQLGYWTSERICALDRNHGAPFNCVNGKASEKQQDHAWLSKGCSSVYHFADDDAHAFSCLALQNGLNQVDYNVTFCPNMS